MDNLRYFRFTNYICYICYICYINIYYSFAYLKKK